MIMLDKKEQGGHSQLARLFARTAMVPRRVESLRKLGFSNEAERQYWKKLVNFRTKLKDKLENFGQTLLLLELTWFVKNFDELLL